MTTMTAPASRIAARAAHEAFAAQSESLTAQTEPFAAQTRSAPDERGGGVRAAARLQRRRDRRIAAAVEAGWLAALR